MTPGIAVKWLVFYGNEELFGQGTVLNVSHTDCQVDASTPVAVGMRLKLWIFTPDRKDPLYVGEARVRWAKRCQFRVQLRRLLLTDHRWLIRFLKKASAGRQLPELGGTQQRGRGSDAADLVDKKTK